jgi:hypothetical protein
MIKHILAYALALSLLACGGSSTVSLDQIVAQIQKTCGFVTSVEDVAKVIVSLVTGFDPNSGATVQVPADIVMKVVDGVCTAVNAKGPTPTPQVLGAEPRNTSVVVNGVLVNGHMQGK